VLAEIEEPKQNNDPIAKPSRSTSQHQEMRSASMTDETNNIGGVPRPEGYGAVGAGNIRRASVMLQQHPHQQHQQQLATGDLDTIETDSLQPLANTQRQPGDGGEIEANTLLLGQQNPNNNRKNKCTACISFPNVQLSKQTIWI